MPARPGPGCGPGAFSPRRGSLRLRPVKRLRGIPHHLGSDGFATRPMLQLSCGVSAGEPRAGCTLLRLGNRAGSLLAHSLAIPGLRELLFCALQRIAYRTAEEVRFGLAEALRRRLDHGHWNRSNAGLGHRGRGSRLNGPRGFTARDSAVVRTRTSVFFGDKRTHGLRALGYCARWVCGRRPASRGGRFDHPLGRQDFLAPTLCRWAARGFSQRQPLQFQVSSSRLLLQSSRFGKCRSALPIDSIPIAGALRQ